MRQPRNPFHYRVVEKIESDDTFLQLFQPSSLAFFAKVPPWDRLQLIRSAQGGGKTSLLRLFTPACLWRIWKDRESSTLGELFTILNTLGAFGDGGPSVLGIVVPCRASYDTLEHLNLSESVRLRLFNALIDARVIAQSVTGVLELMGIAPEGNLSRVRLVTSQEAHTGLPLDLDGEELIRWSRNIEERVWSIIDDGEPEVPVSLEHHQIGVFQSLKPTTLLVDNRQVIDRTLVMFDDVHRLGPGQRTYLLDHAATARASCTVWIAERLQAMQTEEVISLGSAEGRERASNFNLANHWKSAPTRVFESIANSRMAYSAVLDKFADILNDPVDSVKRAPELKRVHGELATRISLRTAGTELFTNLDIVAGDNPSDLYEEIVTMKAAEIVIARNLRRAQPSLDISEGLKLPGKEELKRIRAVAAYQVCREFKLPYYSGIDVIVDMSSANIDQFLDVAGDIFEEVLALRVVNKRPPISAIRQEQVVLAVAKRKWDDIPKRIVDGRDVQNFLKGFADFALPLSLHERASYAPGITGFALTEEDHRIVSNPDKWKLDPNLEEVANILSRCVAHNILYMATDRQQGERGSKKTVFYLNRLLCAHLGLPLGYGGWRLKTPANLHEWIKKGRSSEEHDSVLDLFGVLET